MGNTPFRCVSRGGEGEVPGEMKKVRVLFPDGNIVLLDGPMEAAELMIEHINHMVMHCSIVAVAKGGRTTMTILQPHEKLQPGQAYVLHPIPPPSNKKTKLIPHPVSVPNLNSSEAAAEPARHFKNYENGEKNQQATPFKQRKPRFLQRYQSRVADSSQSENEAQTPALKSTAGDALRRLFSDESGKPQKDLKDHAQVDEAKDDGDLLLNLNMYMGWRPALESIPESPCGYHHPKDMMQQLPPLLCV